MAVQKFSQIALAPSAPASTDYLVGVTGAAVDYRFTAAQVATAVGKTAFPPMIDTGIVYVPGLTSGFNYTIPDNKWHVVLNGSMTLANGTITMPANPINGQVIRVKTTQDIEALDVAPNAGQTVQDHPGILPHGTYFEATYDLSNTTWYIEYIAGALVTLENALDIYVSILAGTIVGGSSYTAGTYGGPEFDPAGILAPVGIPLTGGSGTGATAIVIVSGGAVVDVIPMAQGTGYVIGDVLSATQANLGGTGSGFTFTLTSVGTDLQKGTTLATAFRTVTRAIQEIAGFNLATGFPVNVHVSDGLYTDHITFTGFVGSSLGQIIFTGNLTRRENVHFRPTGDPGTTDPAPRGVVGFIATLGVTMQGFWFDTSDPTFGDWQPVGTSGGGHNVIDQCRLSFPDNADGVMYNMQNAIIDAGNNTYDYGGEISNFGAIANESTLNVNGIQTLNAGTATVIPNIAFFFEILNNSLVNIPGGFSGWGATTGGRFSLQNESRLTTTFADPTQIPGSYSQAAGQQPFRDGNSSYGAFFNHPSPTALSTILFGAQDVVSLPLAGAGGQIVEVDNYGIFNVFPDNFVTPGLNSWFLCFNDIGTARYVQLSTITTGYNYSTPTTGFSLTLGNKDGRAILDPSGTLATGTIVMCPNPFDGQEVEVRTSQTITGLTVSPNAGQSVKAAPTTLPIGTKFSAIYRLANTTWYCAT